MKTAVSVHFSHTSDMSMLTKLRFCTIINIYIKQGLKPVYTAIYLQGVKIWIYRHWLISSR